MITKESFEMYQETIKNYDFEIFIKASAIMTFYKKVYEELIPSKTQGKTFHYDSCDSSKIWYESYYYDDYSHEETIDDTKSLPIELLWEENWKEHITEIIIEIRNKILIDKLEA